MSGRFTAGSLNDSRSKSDYTKRCRNRITEIASKLGLDSSVVAKPCFTSYALSNNVSLAKLKHDISAASDAFEHDKIPAKMGARRIHY